MGLGSLEPWVRTGAAAAGGCLDHVDPVLSQSYMLRGVVSHLNEEQEAAADVRLTDSEV